LSDNEPRYEGFDVPFSTASVGQFHGGIADNVVPRDAEFRYEFRDLPTADVRAMQQAVLDQARALEPGMQRVAPDAGFRFETICEIPSFLGSVDDAVTRLAQRSAAKRAPRWWHSAPKPVCSRTQGFPPWCVAPVSIAQAHQPDEYVSLDQLARCEAFMQGLAASRAIA
jgi:acetylornithine deacetylase